MSRNKAQVPRLEHSPLTGHVFIVTRYQSLPLGGIVASEKHDVTEQYAKIEAERAAAKPKRKSRAKAANVAP